MICTLFLALVPVLQARGGTCFLWTSAGVSDCQPNMTAVECSTAQEDGLWSHGYFIPDSCSGCTTVTDDQGSESLPWACTPEDSGVVWRYLICVGCGLTSDPPPHFDEDDPWCELGSNEECWERQILYRCKIKWDVDT